MEPSGPLQACNGTALRFTQTSDILVLSVGVQFINFKFDVILTVHRR